MNVNMTVRTTASILLSMTGGEGETSNGQHVSTIASPCETTTYYGTTAEESKLDVDVDVDVDVLVCHSGFEVDISDHLSLSPTSSITKHYESPAARGDSSISSSDCRNSFWTLDHLMAQPFIQRALYKDRRTPQSVLSFFFGVDYHNEQDIQDNLVHGGALMKMPPLWFAGGRDYDAVCFEQFASMVRRLAPQQGRAWPGGNGPDDDWTQTVDGLVAQMILCDQISRNAFRGTTEAFAYDEAALRYARQLSHLIFSKQQEETLETAITGTIYPPYLAVLMMALMHAEDVQDHENALRILDLAVKQSPPSLSVWWDQQQTFELEHRKVIDRFGRYPHRNSLKARVNTEEETRWLADADNLPGWAKSQL